MILNNSYDMVEAYIKFRLEDIKKLQTGLNTFFTQLMDAKMKYDKIEITLDMLKEQYKVISSDLLI